MTAACNFKTLGEKMRELFNKKKGKRKKKREEKKRENY